MSRLLITCEHGGRRVPPRYRDLFTAHQALLETHRGWDPGALLLAREMAAALRAPLFAATITRLLVDLNRSIGHHQLHSEATRDLSPARRREIVEAHYRPHRSRVETAMAAAIDVGEPVVHIASHSFTPEMDGVRRDADVALLYDPARPGEVGLAKAWLAALRARRPDLRLRRNYPYQGKGDGLTRLLRQRHAAADYVGIELEVNQRFVERGGPAWKAIRADVIEALREALTGAAAAVTKPAVAGS